MNIGGNGTVIASLANIIALRNLSGKSIEFWAYGLEYRLDHLVPERFLRAMMLASDAMTVPFPPMFTPYDRTAHEETFPKSTVVGTLDMTCENIIEVK